MKLNDNKKISADAIIYLWPSGNTNAHKLSAFSS